MYTRNRVKTEVVLAEFAVPWELRPKRSSEGERERERDSAYLAPRDGIREAKKHMFQYVPPSF